MVLMSTCLVWILFVDRQLPFECDTESTVHTEVLEFTALAKATGLLAPDNCCASLALSYLHQLPRVNFTPSLKEVAFYNNRLIQVWPLNVWFLCFQCIWETKRQNNTLLFNMFCLPSSQFVSLSILPHWVVKQPWSSKHIWMFTSSNKGELKGCCLSADQSFAESVGFQFLVNFFFLWG